MLDLHATFRQTQASSEKLFLAFISALVIFWNVGIETHYKRIRVALPAWQELERLKHTGSDIAQRFNDLTSSRIEFDFMMARAEELRDLYIQSSTSQEYVAQPALYACNRMFVWSELRQLEKQVQEIRQTSQRSATPLPTAQRPLATIADSLRLESYNDAKECVETFNNNINDAALSMENMIKSVPGELQDLMIELQAAAVSIDEDIRVHRSQLAGIETSKAEAQQKFERLDEEIAMELLSTRMYYPATLPSLLWSVAFFVLTVLFLSKKDKLLSIAYCEIQNKTRREHGSYWHDAAFWLAPVSIRLRDFRIADGFSVRNLLDWERPELGRELRALFGWQETELGKIALLTIVLGLLIVIQVRVLWIGLLLSEPPLLSVAEALKQIDVPGAGWQYVERYGAFGCATASIFLICKALFAPRAPHPWPVQAGRPAVSRRDLVLLGSFSAVSLSVFGFLNGIKGQVGADERRLVDAGHNQPPLLTTARHRRRRKPSVQTDRQPGFHRFDGSVFYIDVAKNIYGSNDKDLAKKLEPIPQTRLIQLLKDNADAVAFHDLAYGIEETALAAVQEKRWEDALKILEAALMYDLASIRSSAAALPPTAQEPIRGGIGGHGRPCLRIYDLYAGLAVRVSGGLDPDVTSVLAEVTKALGTDARWMYVSAELSFRQEKWSSPTSDWFLRWTNQRLPKERERAPITWRRPSRSGQLTAIEIPAMKPPA